MPRGSRRRHVSSSARAKLLPSRGAATVPHTRTAVRVRWAGWWGRNGEDRDGVGVGREGGDKKKMCGPSLG
jgi:hypothetical protein